MIRHFSLDNVSPYSINALSKSEEFVSVQQDARSLLIQFYSASTDESAIQKTYSELSNLFPDAIIVGATTVGEIIDGKSVTNKQVLGFTFFEKTKLRVLDYQINSGEEHQLGYQLGRTIKNNHPNTKAVLLLSTPLSIAAADLLKGLEDTSPNFELFGGGAGDYASMNNSLVMSNGQTYSQGTVAVLFEGQDFHVDSRTYLGWRSLSRPMNITKVSGMIVEQIDHRPAFEVYRKYLNIPDDDNFFLNALEFPLLLERHGRLLARVPVGVTPEGGLIFVADVAAGESCRLGYGDPGLIIDDAQDTYQSIESFSPDVVFLYSCGCRRFLMQEDVELETLPVQNIAPTFGFYTYGEFYADKGKLPLLNSTMVAVSFREGEKSVQLVDNKVETDDELPELVDPYANKHARIVSRLVTFINATTSELEQSNQAKSQFLANTSHELRTPLTAISGYAEAINSGDISPESQHKAVEIIHQQSQHLLSLINDILDISKIEAQQLNINTASFDLTKLIEKLGLLFQQQASNKGLTFVIKQASDLPEYVATDQERLYQIMVNLCGNAIKFTEQGEVTVHIKHKNDQLLIAIQDTGIGLSLDQQLQIFKPFSQVVSDKSDSTTGTGLGLSISKHLINLLGGEISVESKLGAGSTFSFWIDAKTCEQQTQISASNQSVGGEQCGSILIAEDNVENGQLFKLLLDNAGYEVDLVENGADAVELALNKDYQLILLDIQMPKMNGTQAMQLLSFSGISTPVVALTANAMLEDVESYLQQGFTSCISKPIQKDVFLQQVSELIQVKTEHPPISVAPDKYQQLKLSAKTSIINELQVLESLLGIGEFSEIKKIAHKLRGLSAQFEMHTIAKACEKIESNNDEELIVIHLENLIRQIKKLSA